MERLRQSRRNRLPQKSSHRNSEAKPPENKSETAGESNPGFYQRNAGNAYFHLVDRRHRFTAENQGGNVPVKSKYAIQELRAIHIQ